MIRLRNGTEIERGHDWARTRLPNGRCVEAHPEARTPAIAEEMGTDVAELTRWHDPLHSLLMDWLSAPYSYSLMIAAGASVSAEIAELEEAAVMAVQKLMIALRKDGH